MGGATTALERELRERLRRLRIDPQREEERVRALAEQVVRDHDQRSLTGEVRPLADPARTASDLVAGVAGFGPLQPLLDDETVEEVWINQPDRVFAARRGRPEPTGVVLTPAQVDELVERMLKLSGRRLDRSTPFVDALLPGGHRLHVALEGIVRGFAAVNIRKHVVRAASLDVLVEAGSLTAHAARFLEAAVRVGLTVLVAGSTQAGKTTLLDCLAATIPGGERIVSAEEVFELSSGGHPDWVAMQTRQAGLEGTGEVRLRDLVVQSLRMRPSRLIVGEVRGAEALDLLIAFNSGLPGLCTIHANTAREALSKLGLLALLAGENVPSSFVVPTVAASVDLVVHLGIDHTGTRRVDEIVAVPGRVEGGVVETATVFDRRSGTLARGAGLPGRLDLFARHGIDVHALLAGER